MSVRSRLRQLLDEAPSDAEAVEFDESWFSWGLLQSVAGSLDRFLNERALGVGARVGVVLENRPEHTAAVVALLASGRCVVTLSPLQPPERLSADIDRSQVPVVVASDDVLSQPGVTEAVAMQGVAAGLNRNGLVSDGGGQIRTSMITQPGVAIEMLTSGTTGTPKRIRISDRQLSEALKSSVPEPKEDQLFRAGVTLVSTPLVHIGGLWGALSALYTGRRITLLPRFSLEPWLRAVERHRPRATGLVPAALRTVLDAGVDPRRLSSLEVVTSGTTFCSPELADEFFAKYGIRVLMTYGATEFAGAVAAWTLPLHKKWWDTKAGSAGRPLPGVEVRAVDSDGAVLPSGEEGYLEIRTEQSADGSNSWVRTSDLAVIDEDGFIWIKGRADDAIVRGGFKVHPGQVKDALERHPAVREASVAPRNDQRLGQVPVAGVELEPSANTVGMSDLIAWCREVLTPYEVPVHVAVLDELPRTPSSKVSRVDLLEQVEVSIERHNAVARPA